MSIENVQEIISYFVIYSFCGWILESVYKTLLQRKLVNSGFLYGPFCPIYGIGSIIMILLLSKFKENNIVLFLISVIVLSIWEYIVGFCLEKIFKIKYWDYSHLKFNIQGRICLSHSIIWGLLGVLFITVIHPNIEIIYNFIPKVYINCSIIVIGLYMIIDCIVSIIKVKNINIKLKILKDITITIKEKTEEMKQIIEDVQAKKKIKQSINELKLKQQEIKEKIELQTYRLRKAFPTMKLKDVGIAINKRIKKIKGEK